MMQSGYLAASLFVGLLSSGTQAQTPAGDAPLPAPLRQAEAAYREKGADGFLPALAKGAPLQSDGRSSFSRAGDMFRAVEGSYGTFIGIELIGTMPVSRSTRVVYFVLNYERGPLYGMVDLYRTPTGDIVTNSNVNTELQEIISPELLARLR